MVDTKVVKKAAKKDGFQKAVAKKKVTPKKAPKKMVTVSTQNTEVTKPMKGNEVCGPRKEQVVSVVLAIFFSFFAWLYTYKRDAWKFWVGLVLSILLVPAPFVWIWAIIDVAVKDSEFYDNYFK